MDGHKKTATFSLFVVVLSVAVVIILSCARNAKRAGKIGVAPHQNTLAVRAGGPILVRYRYGSVPFKPYVQELFTPGGINILRDAPADHLHHHALMFAVTVDGVNFWEEQEAPGRQQHFSFAHYVEVGDSENPHTAGFTEQLDWVNPRGGQVLVKEDRTIKVRQFDDPQVTFLTWQSKFAVPPARESATITGAHYHGLGMRFLESMDVAGQFRNADGKPGVVFRGDERLVRSKWCTYTGKANGNDVTVAMFDHPDNPRHPATWFTMTKPFAYLSATLNLHKESLKVTPDKPLVLRYAVALWDGRVESKQIDRLYQRWIAVPR